MSEQMHTPGPWEAKKGAGWLVTRPGSRCALVVGMCNRTSLVEGACEREAEANSRLIAAAPDLLEALREAVDLAWTETYEVGFDSTVLFGLGYDFDGLESRRTEILTSAGSYVVWPSQLGGNARWSAYGGPDGAMWFEEFSTEQDAKECVMRVLDRTCPLHPAMKARAAIARATGQESAA